MKNNTIINVREEMGNKIGRGDSFSNSLTLLHNLGVVNPIFVEIGTTRGIGSPEGDGWSTNAWGWYVTKYGGQVHTIDLDARAISFCRDVTNSFSENISYHVMSGVEFIKNFDRIIDFLYLDGSDDPQEMVDEYGVAKEKLGETSLILLDDIAPDYLNSGKGQKVIPLLLDDGWEIVYHDTTPRVNQMLFRRKR